MPMNAHVSLFWLLAVAAVGIPAGCANGPEPADDPDLHLERRLRQAEAENERLGRELEAVRTASAAQAQLPETFRSFSVGAPTLAAEISAGTMDSPQGSYRIVDRRSSPEEHVFQIERCVRPTLPPEARLAVRGQQYVRCRVVQITRLDCESCNPNATTFDDVVFARYTSFVTDEAGRPALDNWYATLSIGWRQIRILIEERRFILQESGEADPNLVIVEAPIRRRR